jgi:hypothetical protein
MFANLLEARTGAGAGAAECHRDVTGTTLISLQRLLFPLHHCDIHELELENGRWSLELAHGACRWSLVAGAWSLEPGRWSLEPGAWSLESGAGAWSTWSWSLAHGACDSDVTGSTLISLKYFYFPLQHFPLHPVTPL